MDQHRRSLTRSSLGERPARGGYLAGMRYQQCLMAAALVSMLAPGCRKDKDSTPPSVRILAPGAGFQVSIPDTFTVGVAVSDDRYRNEAERGLVALMGPGFSLISTSIFLVLAAQSPADQTLRNLALMSAILNGLNLLPVLPLDGGHIAQSLLSRQSAAVTVGFNSLTVCAGLSFAILMGAYDLLLILLLIVPFIFSKSAQQHLRLPPLTAPQLALLGIGYAATIAFYAAVVWSMFSGSPVTA